LIVETSKAEDFAQYRPNDLSAAKRVADTMLGKRLIALNKGISLLREAVSAVSEPRIHHTKTINGVEIKESITTYMKICQIELIAMREEAREAIETLVQSEGLKLTIVPSSTTEVVQDSQAA